MSNFDDNHSGKGAETDWKQWARLIGEVGRQIPSALSKSADKIIQEPLNVTPLLPVDSPVQSAVLKVVADLERRLAALVEADCRWSEMAAVAWELFGTTKSNEVAGKIVELVFLRGTSNECRAVLKKLSRTASKFYYHIQPSVRNFMLLRFWLEKADGVFKPLVIKDSSLNLPLEKLFVFMDLLSTGDKSEALIYFGSHEKDIFKAVLESTPQLRISKGDLIVKVADVALRLGYHVEAKRLLDQVTKNDSAFPEASELFLKVDVPIDDDGLCYFGRALAAHDSWQEKVKSLYGFLSDARRVGHLSGSSRPALNKLLGGILEDFVKEPECWASISQMAVVYLDLKLLLPNILSPFVANIIKFHSPLFEKALWSPLENVEFRDRVDTSLWRGVAKLHLFVAGGDELLLWESYDYICEYEALTGDIGILKWRSLRREAINFIARTPTIEEIDRKKCLRQLAIATVDRDLVISDVQAYLSSSEKQPYLVLLRLHRMIMGSNHDQLEVDLIGKKASRSHFTNLDLDRTWHIAIRLKNYDLAWRLATVVQGRERLHESALHPWAISGEKRDQLAKNFPSRKLLEKAMYDMSKNEKRFVRNLLLIGPLLPELFSFVDSGSRSKKIQAPVKGSAAEIAASLISELTWLAKPKKVFYYSFEGDLPTGVRLPVFMQVLPKNIWSLIVIGLVERLGIYSWGFSFKRLGSLLDEVAPKPIGGKTDYFSNRVGRWLRQLTPEQRNAWYDFPSHVRQISESRAADIQAGLVFRMATILNQNHYSALSSLRTMRVPIRVIWHLENWLLSSAYSDIRKYMGGDGRIIIPETLQKMPSLLGVQGKRAF